MLTYLRLRRHFILIGFLILGFLALPVLSRLAVDTVLKPNLKEHNARLTNKYQKILADLELLTEHPVFEKPSYTNNAEFLLSKFLSMEGIDSTSIKNPRFDALRSITDGYANWRFDEDVLREMLADKNLMSLDTSWVNKLNSYDHWNYSYHREIISSLSAVNEVNAMTRLEIFSQLPQPNFNGLRSWALLNFLKLHKAGRGNEGIHAFRHIANLLHSSGNLVASMAAASMLRDEYVLMARFRVKGWEPIPLYYIDTYARVTWAWMALLKIPYFDELPPSFRAYLKPQNGICAGALEAVSNFSLYRDFFEPQNFFEANFATNINYTKKLYLKIQNDCNLNVYNKFLERSPASLNPLSSFTLDEVFFKRNKNTDYSFSLMDNWIYLPYIRRLVGLVYFGEGGPMNYVMPYEAKRKKFLGLNEGYY